MSHRPKHIVEYAALRVLSAVFQMLPLRLALGLGWGLAWFAFHVLRFRRAEAERRIREVFDTRYRPREVRRMAWLSLRNLCFSIVETARLPQLTRPAAEAATDCAEGLGKLRQLLAGGRGAIFAVPHMGNWELAGVTGHLFGLPMFYIVGRQRNPLADAYLNRMRSVTGIDTIPRDASVLKSVIKRLRAGKVLAFTPDLRSKTPGVSVHFLGQTANMVGGMGLFARQADVPVIPIVVTRVGWAHHRWDVADPVYPDPAADKESDWQRITQQVVNVFDAAIRQHPEQYFWYNKRWVLDPLEVGEPGPANVA